MRALWLSVAAVSFLLTPSHAALASQTRLFAYEDQTYLYRHQHDGGAVLLPDDPRPDSALPLVVLLHGTNSTGELHLWLGGGGRDLRPLAVSLMQGGVVAPFLLAAPSQTRSGGSGRSLWSAFDLASFIDAVGDTAKGLVQIDRDRIVLVGHSGAGCNPEGGLAGDFWSQHGPSLLGLVSIDPCLDAEMGSAMAKRPVSVPLLLWWQSQVWERKPIEFWSALTLNQEPARLDRMQELRVPGSNPHDAIVPIAFARALRELLPPPESGQE